MAYSDVLNKVSQIKLNNLNLILAKLRQGDGGSPYTAPPKEKTGPFVPAPKKDVANITPKDFSPPPIRYIPHIRIPSIKEAEMSPNPIKGTELKNNESNTENISKRSILG